MSIAQSETAGVVERPATKVADRAVFRIVALYGVSKESVRMPLTRTHAIDSGQMTLSLDPDPSPAGNVGTIDFSQLSVTVRYDAQLIFPGLHSLLRESRFEPSLLGPVRVTATDKCQVTEDYSGWRAAGCLEFLPGSIWSGAKGG